MSLIEVPWNPSSRDLRLFAGLQCVPALLLAGWLRSRGPVAAAPLVVAVSVVLALVGLIRPQSIRPIYVGWMVLTFPIGWAVSHLVLAIAFYLVVTPIGWAMRIWNHDPMQRRFDSRAATYWQLRPPPPEPARYFRQF